MPIIIFETTTGYVIEIKPEDTDHGLSSGRRPKMLGVLWVGQSHVCKSLGPLRVAGLFVFGARDYGLFSGGCMYRIELAGSLSSASRIVSLRKASVRCVGVVVGSKRNVVNHVRIRVRRCVLLSPFGSFGGGPGKDIFNRLVNVTAIRG